MEPEYRRVPLALIDRPELDARIDRDPEKLRELQHDIERRGMIQPMIIVPVGDRFEVVDGFRRYIAATWAGLVTVPCAVYPSKQLATEGIKYAANIFREDMSPAEEAVFFHELYTTECAQDVDRICSLVGKTRDYVEGRLELLLGDEQVFAALKERKISIGVARELNKLPKEDYRRYYLHLAIQDGATVSVVAGWVVEWKKLYGAPQVEAPATPAAPTVIVPAGHDPTLCVVCRKNDPRFIPELVPIHTHCRLAVLDQMLAAYRGEQA